MKIVARIEKTARNQYVLDGQTFDSFLSARRELVARMKQRRDKQQKRITPAKQS